MRVLVNPTELLVHRTKDQIGNDCLLFYDGEQVVAKGMFVYDQTGLNRFELKNELVASASGRQFEKLRGEAEVIELFTQLLEAVGIDNVTLKLETTP